MVKKVKPETCGSCIFYRKQFYYESSECSSGKCVEPHARREYGNPPTVLARYEAGSFCKHGIMRGFGNETDG